MTLAPTIQRACLDKLTGTVTVYFAPSDDLCGSFVSYELWGRDNVLFPFSKLATGSTQTALQIQAALPNQKKWQFYIAALYACNGTDTLFSDTIFVDDKPPGYLEPDSVSVDLVSQQMVAGWPKAPEPDVMGYTLFRQNPSNGYNVLVDEKNTLFYTFDLLTFKPDATGNRFTLAVYDSCRNGGVISNYHSPVLMDFVSGQNADYQCTRKIYMRWTGYIGWVADSYDVYVKDDVTNTWSIAGTFGASVFDFVFNIPTLGPTYSFFVRAHKTGSTVTSSSNVIAFATSDFVPPAYGELGHVSVVGNGAIEITGGWGATPSLSAVLLQYRNYGSSTWAVLKTFSPALGSIGKHIDNNRNTATQKYEYRLLFLNTCNEAFDSSRIHISLLLRRNLNLFYWNGYWGWSGLAHGTDLQQKEKQSSTWNDEFLFPDSQFLIIDTLKSRCFRVASVRFGINNKPVDTAYSNQLCLRAIDTTLIPGAFSPGGQNPIFKVYNPNLEPGQANLKIYSRWGQKIFEGDALIGWDGKMPDNNFALAGLYVYFVEVRTIEKIETFKGVLTLLR